MAYNILILGASYGSLLATKIIMSGHNATLVCRPKTAALINQDGTEVRIRLKGEAAHTTIRSSDQPGQLRAAAPIHVAPEDFDLVCLAMQEPQYRDPEITRLMRRIARARVPCLSMMNMPPPPYLKRLAALADVDVGGAYTCPDVWAGFDPGLVSLCSPDPQAYRPADEGPNVLHVGLPTNFKAAPFRDAAHNAMLQSVSMDIDAVRLHGKDVPVKLRIFNSLFVPLAKWSMLLTGNYRCIDAASVCAIKDAVYGDLDKAKIIYDYVGNLVLRLGARPQDLVPFEKYAAAAKGLEKPSSVAKALAGGSTHIERVDKLIQTIGRTLNCPSPIVDEIVATVDQRIFKNRLSAGLQDIKKEERHARIQEPYSEKVGCV